MGDAGTPRCARTYRPSSIMRPPETRQNRAAPSPTVHRTSTTAAQPLPTVRSARAAAPTTRVLPDGEYQPEHVCRAGVSTGVVLPGTLYHPAHFWQVSHTNWGPFASGPEKSGETPRCDTGFRVKTDPVGTFAPRFPRSEKYQCAEISITPLLYAKEPMRDDRNRRPRNKKRPKALWKFMVVGGGLEPSARGFSVRCSTN